jgi:hypothetical protein
MTMPKSFVTITIPAGQAVSGTLDLTNGSMMSISAPADWTPANVSFLLSADNVTFDNLYDGAGVEIIKPMGPGRAIIIDPSLTVGAIYMKIRSGPASNPVLQAADRTFTVVIA